MEISGVERLKCWKRCSKSRTNGCADSSPDFDGDGATLLDDAELKQFARLAAAAKSKSSSLRPARELDVGRQIATPEGVLSGLRHRGSDQLSYVIADMCAASKSASWLSRDRRRLLWLLNEMRAKGDLPPDVIFKVSIFAGHASAAGGRVLQLLGANTF